MGPSMVVVALVACAAFTAHGTLGEQDSKPTSAPVASFADAAFLSGAWVAQDGRSEVEEFWSPAKAGTMLGASRTIAGGRTVFFEHLRIVEKKEGVFYEAQPGGRPATPFRLVRSGPGRLEFENPEHDFPSKIAYELGSDGVLTAEISGLRNGKRSAQRWRYRRPAPTK
jgi:hypothetical protein